jgi:MYXO-CTERM domain-containing protein
VNTADTTGGIFTLRSSTTGNPVVDVMVGADGSSTTSGRLMALVRDDFGAGLADVVSGSAVNNSTWHLVTATRTGTTLELYMDATSQGTTTISSGAITTDTRNLGREGRWVQDNYNAPPFTSADYYLAANLDEARASSVARDIDWVTTDYNNQNSPTTFLTGYTTGIGAGNGEVTTNSTTSVDLLSLDATASCAGTTIAWQMAQGIDTLGFNVFREANGVRVKMNGALVPGQALSGGAGERYSFVDPGPLSAGRIYWVENVTVSLDSRWYGPVAPLATPDCDSIVVSGPVQPAVPTASPSGAAPAESASDQMGGCAVAGDGGHGSGAIPLALVALAVAGYRRRRRL